MIIVEFMKDNKEHIAGNSAMVATCINKYNNEIINLFCGKNHFNAILEELTKHNINILQLNCHAINPISRIIRDYEEFFLQLSIIKKVFSFAKKNNENKILFTYTTSYSLYILKLFCLLNPKIKVQTIIHAELEKIDTKEYLSNTVLNKLQVLLYIKFFGIQNPLSLPTPKNLKYIVYGDAIKENAIKIMPNLQNDIIAIPHPYLWDICLEHFPNELNFGIIGRCHAVKTIPVLKKVCKDLEKIYNKQFKLMFSGYIDNVEFYEYLKKLSFVYQESLSDKRISNELRDDTIKKMAYAVFTYNLGSYKYTASGAFMNAINFEKPIIALSNSYIKSYFDKYGNIGYLCNSYEELYKKIISVINNFPKEEYELQKINIRKVKQYESIENIRTLI